MWGKGNAKGPPHQCRGVAWLKVASFTRVMYVMGAPSRETFIRSISMLMSASAGATP